jgi:hypothetical protein
MAALELLGADREDFRERSFELIADAESPFSWIERFSAAASNQPVRRGRPVVAPNSWPRWRNRSPTSSESSVGNGPPPTRVV